MRGITLATVVIGGLFGIALRLFVAPADLLAAVIGIAVGYILWGVFMR